MAKAKTINLLLEDGNLDGLLTVEDSSWDGIMFVSPREGVEKLFRQEETNFWGVYLLISDKEVYTGQASGLQRRIKEHDRGKDFWKKVVLITTKDDSLNRSAIDYIEHDLIDKSKQAGTLRSENKQGGNKTKVSRFDKVRYDNFIENVLLLLELIGIKVFVKTKKNLKKKNINRDLINSEENIIPIFIKSRTGADGRGFFDKETQKVTILKGTKVADITRNTFRPIKLYNDIKAGQTLTENLLPLSPSTSADIILRSSNNGWNAWKDSENQPLQKYRKKNNVLDTELEMAWLYLYEGLSFRRIEIEALGIPIEKNPRGFEAKKRLNALGIVAENKGSIKENGYEYELSRASGKYKEILNRLKNRLED